MGDEDQATDVAPATKPVEETAKPAEEVVAEKKVDTTDPPSVDADADIEASKAEAKASKGVDKPTNSIPLLACAAFFLAVFIAATVLSGLSAGNRLPSMEGRKDLSPPRYEFQTVPFQVPFPFILAAFAGGVLGLAVLAVYAWDVLKKDVGNARMVEISGYIAEGSIAFLKTEYMYLGMLVVVLFILLGFAQNWASAGCYLIGALLSAATGFVGKFYSCSFFFPFVIVFPY